MDQYGAGAPSTARHGDSPEAIRPVGPRVSPAHFAVINVPVWLLLAGAALVAVIGGQLELRAWLRWAPIVLAWWMLSAALLLFLDYFQRKRFLYDRLCRTGLPGPRSPLALSLKQTLCGLMVYAAVRDYWANRRE